MKMIYGLFFAMGGLTLALLGAAQGDPLKVVVGAGGLFIGGGMIRDSLS